MFNEIGSCETYSFICTCMLLIPILWHFEKNTYLVHVNCTEFIEVMQQFLLLNEIGICIVRKKYAA